MPRKPKASRKPTRVNYPKITIPVEFEVTYQSGWKEGALAMTIAGGEVTHAGKKIGSINANAFSGAPVITLHRGEQMTIIQCNAMDLFRAVAEAFKKAEAAGLVKEP